MSNKRSIWHDVTLYDAFGLALQSLWPVEKNFMCPSIGRCVSSSFPQAAQHTAGTSSLPVESNGGQREPPPTAPAVASHLTAAIRLQPIEEVRTAAQHSMHSGRRRWGETGDCSNAFDRSDKTCCPHPCWASTLSITASELLHPQIFSLSAMNENSSSSRLHSFSTHRYTSTNASHPGTRDTGHLPVAATAAVPAGRHVS